MQTRRLFLKKAGAAMVGFALNPFGFASKPCVFTISQWVRIPDPGWHHYLIEWGRRNGNARVYIDGVFRRAADATG